jgi:small subunit ribosomal protein S16
MGKKKQPIYKIVAADSRAKRDGRFLEAVGLYNPLKEPIMVDFIEDRLFHWLKKGALPTDTVKSLMSRKGLQLKWTLMKKKKDDATIAAEMEKWQMMQASKLEKEAAKKARRKAAKKKVKAASETPAAAEAAPAAEAPAQ